MNKAVLAAQLPDRELRDPGRILADRERLLEHVVGEAEAWLERCRLERRLRLERQVSAVHPTVDGMASPLIRVPLRAAHEWHRRRSRGGRSAWRWAYGRGTQSLGLQRSPVGSGLSTSDRKLPTRMATATTVLTRNGEHTDDQAEPTPARWSALRFALRRLTRGRAACRALSRGRPARVVGGDGRPLRTVPVAVSPRHPRRVGVPAGKLPSCRLPEQRI